MIDRIMKNSGEKAYGKDLERLDRSALSTGIIEKTDVRYSSDDSAEHTLDIYYKIDGTDKPVLIDIHGGGFISHDKKVDSVFANVMAQKGFVVFSLNYRLAYPEYNVFDQIEDVDTAVRWIVAHASGYGGDKERLFLAGHSSGGVNAVAEALLTISPEMLSDYGLQKKEYRYKGLLLDCGLMHFYKNSIGYAGMRNMVFPKGYKNDPRYRHLIFEKNRELSNLPQVAIITNESDELKKMSYYFGNVLEKNRVNYQLFNKGPEGHMGMIFHPMSEETDLITEFLLKKEESLAYTK